MTLALPTLTLRVVLDQLSIFVVGPSGDLCLHPSAHRAQTLSPASAHTVGASLYNYRYYMVPYS